MTAVPFLDLGAAYAELRDEIDAALLRIAGSGTFVGGSEVEDFEHEFADYCGTSHAVGVGNGLDALRLALMAMDVGRGDEVIVPANTFIATWLAVSQCGAIPVPVEPLPETHNIDPARIEAAIGPRTRAIVPVHLYGQPADLDPILDIARRRGLRVLEDAAQAHGARYKGRRIGSHGDAAAWSFYPAKNLGAMGDGGAVTTSDPKIADRIRSLRDYGFRKKHVSEVRGFNTRLDALQAAVLRVKLRHLEDWNARRRAIASLYFDDLAGTAMVLPAVPACAEPVWHLFVVRHARRDALQRHLAEAGVGTSIHYPIPPHRQQAYADAGFAAGALPIATRLADEVLSLPMGPHLEAEGARKVARILREWCNRREEAHEPH